MTGVQTCALPILALLGKEVGDEITVNAPRGRINYEIIDIQFKKKTA